MSYNKCFAFSSKRSSGGSIKGISFKISDVVDTPQFASNNKRGAKSVLAKMDVAGVEWIREECNIR